MLLNYDRIRLAMARKAYGIPELASAYGVSKQRMNVIVTVVMSLQGRLES